MQHRAGLAQRFIDRPLTGAERGHARQQPAERRIMPRKTGSAARRTKAMAQPTPQIDAELALLIEALIAWKLGF